MPLSNETLISLAGEYGTPLWVYDASAIRRRIAQLSAFDVVRYAQKACSNIHVLDEMRKAGVRVDAVSLGEIERAKRAGFAVGNISGTADVVFTADLLDRATLDRVVADGIEVNAGSIDMLRQLGERSPGHRVWLRLNPGFGHGHSNKTNTGGESSKHGIWFEQLQDAMALVRRHALTLVGLHMHIGSGVDYGHLQRVCGAMVDLCRNLGADIEAVSAGGGLSVPYREEEDETQVGHAVRLEIEPGRYLVADSGVLVSEVRAVKTMGRNRFVLVDAGFSELARPAMYGSYHRISAIPERTQTLPSIIAGPLCESGDVFTQTETGTVLPRDLPEVEVGDHLVFHGAGAYGATMSSNYNSRLYAPEVLVEESRHTLIRRRQTLDELLTLETGLP
jgi:diaminopimelate decarboxylase